MNKLNIIDVTKSMRDLTDAHSWDAEITPFRDGEHEVVITKGTKSFNNPALGFIEITLEVRKDQNNKFTMSVTEERIRDEDDE